MRSIRLNRLASVALCAAAAFSTRPLLAQDTPREVRQKAQMTLAQGNYADAIGLLQQLIEWFGNETKDTVVASMEPIYYNLGTCHFLLSNFGEARTAFDTYLKKYRTAIHAPEALLYIADSFRFEGELDKARKEYLRALKRYEYPPDLKADVYAAMARCHLAEDHWDRAMPWLRKLYVTAPDLTRRNWAATLLTTAYLKQRQLDNVYRLIPYLLLPNSFASRSVALNMAGLEVGDELFGEEKYRDAMWVYRLVYPRDTLRLRSEQYLDLLQRRAERLKRIPDSPRPLLRVLEAIGELEAEIKALAQIDNYDIELHFRMARSYMEIFRYREARDLFLYLYGGEAEGRQAEEALYFAFRCCAQLQPWDRAFELGREYMRVYPSGEFFDPITLMMGQMYAKLQDWPNVLDVLGKALEISPKHSEAAECMFLLGYASFMEEKFTDAVDWLRKMNREYPGNDREPDGIYWTGMALMFDKKFEEASPEFDAILMRFPQCPYVMDSAFRRAVCDYGLSKFREAEQRLLAFVEQYPTNKLSGEAFMMLGDVSGTYGELQQAVVRYRRVGDYDINIEFYNHSMFRCGEILAELNDFPALVQHFNEYIDRNREGSNVPLAMYWVATGMWSMNEQRGALEYFRKGIETYGQNPKELGIDLILEEWVGKTRAAEGDIGKNAWKDLEDLLVKAKKEGKQALVLRLQRIFLYGPNASDESKAALLADIMQPDNLTNASPGVLELILDQALKETNTGFAVQIAEYTVKEFPETDYGLSARMVLARTAIERKDYSAAVRQLGVIREVFATSGEAAEALMMLGDIYIRQSKFAEAMDSYKSILEVREWRGPLWPAALYGMGEAARLQRNFAEASAFYERIYLMYGNYKEWVAKAYLARADCLTRLQQYNKAAETLRDMIDNRKDLEDMPQYKEARQQLVSLDARVKS